MSYTELYFKIRTIAFVISLIISLIIVVYVILRELFYVPFGVKKVKKEKVKKWQK